MLPFAQVKAAFTQAAAMFGGKSGDREGRFLPHLSLPCRDRRWPSVPRLSPGWGFDRLPSEFTMAGPGALPKELLISDMRTAARVSGPGAEEVLGKESADSIGCAA